MSFWGCMLSPMTTEKSSSSEGYSSSMEQLKWQKRSKTQETGCRCFEFTRKQSSLSSLTERKNLKIMWSKLPLSSRLSPRSITQLLSTTIRQSEPALEMCRISSSQTSLSLRISDSSGFTHSDRDSEIQTLGVCRFLCGAHNLSGCSDYSDTTCWGLTALPVLGVHLKEFKNHEAL